MSFNKKYYDEVYFDLDKPSTKLYSVKQGDTRSRGFYVKMLQNNLEVPVDKTNTITLYMRKPDNKVVAIAGEIEGDMFRIDLSEQALTACGIAVCDLELVSSTGETVGAKSFKLHIERSAKDGILVSTNERGILDRAFELANVIVPRIELLDLESLEGILDVEATRVASESKRVTDEAKRATSEDTRIANENGRVTAETLRNTTETNVKANEAIRVIAENNRVIAEESRVASEKDIVTSETIRVASETKRDIDEGTRIISENNRVTDEGSRAVSEAKRVTDEGTRIASENNRVTDENSRVLAETNRVTSENVRVDEEVKRTTVENKRVTDETVRLAEEVKRVTAETKRVTDEGHRALAETNRTANEDTRVVSENKRVTDEGHRVTNEGNRATSEDIRLLAENNRVSEEAKRVIAENKRESEEAKRVIAENKRESETNVKANEAVRVIAENKRVIDEGVRVASETNRTVNENTRVTNEDTRVLAEQVRETNYLEKISNFVAETEKVEALYPTRLTDLENNKADKSKVITVEKELYDYKNTMANMNVNQEAKQKVSGYGSVSLPKNSANGQVSVSVKGLTTTNMFNISNVKSTISASRLKSVGKNLFSSIKNGKTQTFENEECWTTNNFTVLDRGFKENIRYTVGGKGSHFAGYASRWGIEHTDGSVIYSAFYGTTLTLKTLTSDSGKTVKRVFLDSPSQPTISHALVKNSLVIYEGTIATPYEPYKETTAYLPNIGELRSLPNGTKDEIRVSGGKAELVKRVDKKILQASDITNLIKTNTNNDVVYVKKPLDYIGYNNATLHANTVLINGFTMVYKSVLDVLDNINNIHSNQIIDRFYITLPKGIYVDLADAQTKLAGLTLTYQLAQEIVTPIQTSGNLISYPSGTIYVENVVADASNYTTKFDIKELQLPIKSIDKLIKYNFTTGVQTVLDTTLAVINADKKSFTHPGLAINDMVFVDYFYDVESTLGETTIEYYDSRHTIKDTVNNKFYKWDIKSTNGVPTVALMEVL